MLKSQSSADWWKTASVYQIYPRSFQDSNNDGIGYLQGIKQRAGYLSSLGIDAVWLSPFYPSHRVLSNHDKVRHVSRYA